MGPRLTASGKEKGKRGAMEASPPAWSNLLLDMGLSP